MSSAYLLISHGSRDQRPHLAMEKLAELVGAKLATRRIYWGVGRVGEYDLYRSTSKSVNANTTAPAVVTSSSGFPLVGTAILELAEVPLHEQIRQFASLALAAGYNQLQLLPVFLLPGVHVSEDIPAEVALAQQSLGGAIKLKLLPYLGTHPGLRIIMASQLVGIEVDAKILLSHGTRRVNGNQPVEAMADYLGAVAAYFSVSPSLEEQVQVLATAGYRQIMILPYFFFCGGITDAIAQMVAQIQLHSPKLSLRLGEPIGASDPLADLIVDLVKQK
ncbi:MAG: sirohydrochlorin chelatase [Merismopedia sp. SIO2A8]|nr:sirohydrochlorin chelatase [Symploca sp. SIO2B6]NET51798.1 sirohydrochlorin chelatase [Merismopedia sp. SIO2A8]